MTDQGHNHRGPKPCPECGFDPAHPHSEHRLDPTEIRKGREGIAKARAALRNPPKTGNVIPLRPDQP